MCCSCYYSVCFWGILLFFIWALTFLNGGESSEWHSFVSSISDSKSSSGTSSSIWLTYFFLFYLAIDEVHALQFFQIEDTKSFLSVKNEFKGSSCLNDETFMSTSGPVEASDLVCRQVAHCFWLQSSLFFMTVHSIKLSVPGSRHQNDSSWSSKIKTSFQFLDRVDKV